MDGVPPHAALRATDSRHYRLPSFQAKLGRTRDLIAEALATMHDPYVAFSGGKDSLCVLALVREQYPHVRVNWSDDELEYPEQPGYITGLARDWDLNLTITLGYAQHAGWFRPWTDAPYWREPVPGTLRIDMDVAEWVITQGWDGVFLGLRKAENSMRRRYLDAMGRLHDTKRLGWRCNPLAGWSTDDVWALIAGLDLPYNPAYDRMALVAIPRAEQRVGPLPLSPGWLLRAGWPRMHAALRERYGPRWL